MQHINLSTVQCSMQTAWGGEFSLQKQSNSPNCAHCSGQLSPSLQATVQLNQQTLKAARKGTVITVFSEIFEENQDGHLRSSIDVDAIATNVHGLL